VDGIAYIVNGNLLKKVDCRGPARDEDCVHALEVVSKVGTRHIRDQKRDEDEKERRGGMILVRIVVKARAGDLGRVAVADELYLAARGSYHDGGTAEIDAMQVERVEDAIGVACRNGSADSGSLEDTSDSACVSAELRGS
jgi:hypothetical protein